ncbi:hypothetical protein E0504_39955 [Parafrankia sp. BMG5.11]|nr:hypothetical protein E0504_39955 [Parafrankia sp. BMG5.11]
MTVSSGALLRDFIDVTATLPSIVYVDHRPVTRGGTDVTLIFRSMREGGSGVGGGWVPPDTPAGPAAWTSYQDSLHSLLLAAPGGPTGERLVGELVHLDPRSVVALADILCRRHPARA